MWRGNGDRLWRRRRKKSTRGEGEVEVEGEDRCRNKARPLSKFGGRAHRHWTDTGSFGKGKPAHQVIFFPDQPRGWPGTYTLLAGFSVRGPLTAPFTCCACSVKKTPPPGHVSPAERPSIADCSVSARPVRLQTLELSSRLINAWDFGHFVPTNPETLPPKTSQLPPQRLARRQWEDNLRSPTTRRIPLLPGFGG